MQDDSALGCELWLARDKDGAQLLSSPEARSEARGHGRGLQDAARKLIASGMTREQVAALLGLDPDSF